MLKRKLMIVVYIILGVVALALIAAIFTRKEYTIKKDIVINKPDSVVYEYLRFFKNHPAFNAWYMKDPDMKVTSRNTDGQVGFILMYEGNKAVGSGEQELTGLEKNRKVDIELRFLKPFKSISETPFDLEPLNINQTKVTWTMYGKMNYPMNLALLFINMDNFLGKDVQKSLENLKANLEK